MEKCVTGDRDMSQKGRREICGEKRRTVLLRPRKREKGYPGDLRERRTPKKKTRHGTGKSEDSPCLRKGKGGCRQQTLTVPPVKRGQKRVLYKEQKRPGGKEKPTGGKKGEHLLLF